MQVKGKKKKTFFQAGKNEDNKSAPVQESYENQTKK